RRHRTADSGQHARGRAAGRARLPHRLRRQRPDGAGAREGAAGEHAGRARTYVDADAREPEKILAAAAETLDLTEPVALVLSGIMGHVPDTDEARWIVRRFMDGLAPGSYLSLNDGTSVVAGEAVEKAQQGYDDTGAVPYRLRTPEEIESFFDGLELVPPGVVSCPQWR